jgi:formylglycine-generating enzyme required for sulfatase activity
VKAFFRQPRVAIPALLLLLAVLAAGAWFGVRTYRERWARNVALPEIARLLEQENFDAAFRLGKQAEQYIPGHPQLLDFKRHYAVAAFVQSNPSEADVYVKGYLNADASWLHLGKTPIDAIPVPAGYLRWRVTKEGLAPAEGAFTSYVPVEFALHLPENSPRGMVSVPKGRFQFRGFPQVELEDFWLDKYEVTNKQFKEFVDQGGYAKREYWKHPFVKNGKVFSWEQAIAEFRDTTGRPGPSTWQVGAYPQGRDEFPVNGVSWYEAAAYAEFLGKSLPTIYHWLRAAPTTQFSEILRLSNFSGQGPAQVGSHSGLSLYGSYDMAGNVREWSWNQVEGVEGGRRYILGASWGDAPYLFNAPGAAHPWDRSAINGFRCAKYGAPLSAALTAPVENVSRDYSKEKPVSDEIFQVYRSFYSYERSDLKPEVESVDDSALHWRRETVTFNAAYGNERVMAYLFLPRNAAPPYQTVVYFPSGLARRARSSDELDLELRYVDFLPRIGRAVLFLVYKGTYERHLGRPATYPWDKDLVISWSRDFSRAIDYLETRPDIDHQNLGYYSFSNPVMPVLSAIDGRVKAGVHIGTGFFSESVAPEYDPLHFAPRAKEPTLMIGGRYDFIAPLETSQMPMFRLLGAPEKDKRLALFDTGHAVRPVPDVIKEILAWFDRYLGPVNTK